MNSYNVSQITGRRAGDSGFTIRREHVDVADTFATYEEASRFAYLRNGMCFIEACDEGWRVLIPARRAS